MPKTRAKPEKPEATHENIRNAKPYSLNPLTPEAALRQIMSAPPPKEDPKPKKKNR